MNYDLDTEEGMKNAVVWTQNLLSQIRDGGTWMVPRSGTVITVDHTKNRIFLTGLLPDPSITRVLVAAGYTVVEEE